MQLHESHAADVSLGGESNGRNGASSDGLLLGVGVGGAGCRRFQHARQVDVEVLDFDLATAAAECSGKEFREAACSFPD